MNASLQPPRIDGRGWLRALVVAAPGLALFAAWRLATGWLATTAAIALLLYTTLLIVLGIRFAASAWHEPDD